MPKRPITAAETADSPCGRAMTSGDAAGSPVEANDQLLRLQQQLNRLQRTVRLTIEAEIASFVGKSFGSLETNQQVASSIHELLEAHGLRVRCPECGHPGILRCSGRPGMASGVFVIDHTIEGRRTFHLGVATVPELRLTRKPPRRLSKRAS